MKLAITCGVFDCLNAPHIHLINSMRKQVLPDGNIMVLLFDDYATFRLKGVFPTQKYSHRESNLSYLTKYIKQIFNNCLAKDLKNIVNNARKNKDKIYFVAYDKNDLGVDIAKKLKVPVKIIKQPKI